MNEHDETEEIASRPYSALIIGGLRTIAASVPGLSSLAQAWTEYEGYRTAQRIQELFNNVRAEFENLRQAIAQRSSPLREDSPELLEIVIEKVQKEFDKAKRATYARILARLLGLGNAAQHAESVSILESLDHLSELDLRVLTRFGTRFEVEIGDLDWQELGLSGEPQDQVWAFSGTLAKLESRGLIVMLATHSGGVYVQGPLDATTTRWLKTKYRVLPLGSTVIKLLTES
jgi:hypothetical protein